MEEVKKEEQTKLYVRMIIYTYDKFMRIIEIISNLKK